MSNWKVKNLPNYCVWLKSDTVVASVASSDDVTNVTLEWEEKCFQYLIQDKWTLLAIKAQCFLISLCWIFDIFHTQNNCNDGTYIMSFSDKCSNDNLTYSFGNKSAIWTCPKFWQRSKTMFKLQITRELIVLVSQNFGIC